MIAAPERYSPIISQKLTIDNTHFVFLALVTIFGLAFFLVVPPFDAPDEEMHFLRAYSISELQFWDAIYPVPKPFNNFFDEMRQIRSEPGASTNLGRIQKFLFTPVDLSQGDVYEFAPSTYYPPLIYLPQAAGLSLPRLFNGSAGLYYYLARLFNLLVYAALVYAALRITPTLRWLFLLLAMMPMPLFLAASLSPDAMTNGLAFLLIALIVRGMSDRVSRMTWRETAWIALGVGLVSVTKVPYFLLSLAFLLIPRQKFSSWKDYLLKASVVFVVTILVLLVVQMPLLIKDNNMQVAGVGADIISIKLDRIIHTPFGFLSMFFQTVFYKAIGYFFGYQGVLGWLNIRLPLPAYPVFPFVVLMVLYFDGTSLELNRSQRITAAAIGVIIFAALHLLMYVSYTGIDEDLIQGVQGRYFLPLGVLPYLLLVRSKVLKYDPLVATCVFWYLVVFLGIAVYTVAARFYGFG